MYIQRFTRGIIDCFFFMYVCVFVSVSPWNGWTDVARTLAAFISYKYYKKTTGRYADKGAG